MASKLLSSLGAALAVTLAVTGARATTSCSFTTVVGVAFGTYDVFSTSPLDSTGSVTVLCTGVGPSDTIVIDMSRGNASSFGPRQMLRGGTALDYNLFLDAARTTVWGDGTSGTSHYGPTMPPSGVGLTVPIYGRIPARQNAAAGAYSDTLVVTIVF
ncbi:MAG: spore coat U domain-containing protein [Byssovorax sp.]